MGEIIDKLEGTAMQVEGKITNDKVRMVQGTALASKGRLEGFISRFVGRVKSTVTRPKVRNTPPT
jgi:uncharacterized protein YjbJ (UPF0337 family)